MIELIGITVSKCTKDGIHISERVKHNIFTNIIVPCSECGQVKPNMTLLTTTKRELGKIYVKLLCSKCLAEFRRTEEYKKWSIEDIVGR